MWRNLIPKVCCSSRKYHYFPQIASKEEEDCGYEIEKHREEAWSEKGKKEEGFEASITAFLEIWKDSMELVTCMR